MLINLRELEGYTIEAADGHIGHVRDFFFDDHSWTVRYLVADTGNWLPGRNVLVATDAFKGLDRENRRFTVNLTKKQIEASPTIEEHMPVSRQHEYDIRSHYSWPIYWSNESAPITLSEFEPISRVTPTFEANLESTNDVINYHFHATDGSIGHLEALIVDESWVIRYLVVDTRNWWPGKRVILSPDWITSFDTTARMIQVDHLRDQIGHSPAYHPEVPIEREYEERLYEHYGRGKYWVP